MTHTKRISILGCGWLGLPLAKELIKAGYSLKGSTTSPDKLNLLASCHIDPFLVHFGSHQKIDINNKFFSSDILIITIPPKKQLENYLSQISELAGIIPKTTIKRVIYISSTSVYSNKNKEFNEEDATIPDTAAGKALFFAEELLLNNPAFQTSVIRFGGLTGPGRHPAGFLTGKTKVPNGLAPINLIHLDDCIGIIKAILLYNHFGKIWNACSPDHPSRRDFYTLACQVAGLPEPMFIHELGQWKIINSIRTSELLGYEYQIKDWISWLHSGRAVL